MSGIETLTKKYNIMSKSDKYGAGFLAGYRQAVVDLQAEKEKEKIQLNENQKEVYDLAIKEISTCENKVFGMLKTMDTIAFSPDMFVDEIEDSIVELTEKELLQVFRKSIDDLLKGEANE